MTSPSPQTPAPVSSDALPTRRALREREAAAAAQTRRPARTGVAVATGPAARAPRPARPSRPAGGQRLRAGIALSFAALLMAGTSLSGLAQAETFSTAPTAAPQADPQQLLTASGTSLSVTRDGYRATTPEELAQARAAAARAAAAEKAASIGFRTASTFSNNPLSAVQWPFPVGVPISDGFGPRSSPGGIGSTNHKGVDFTPGQGKPIGAVAAGVVSLVQRSDGGGLGVYVVIDHVIDGQPVTSWYGHMLVGSPTVEVGQAVLPGQQIGSVGNTGTSTGAHLHLEIHEGNTPVDPYAWLVAHN